MQLIFVVVLVMNTPILASREPVQKDRRSFHQASSGGWRKNEARPVVEVSALTLLVGWQEGHQVHKITVPLTSKGSVPEQMEEETKEEPSNQGSPGHTYTTVLRSFIRDHPGEPVQEDVFYWIFMVQRKITQADTPTIRTNQWPTFVIAPFLRRMPFLPQPTLPLYPGLGHAPNMLACIPSGMVKVHLINGC